MSQLETNQLSRRTASSLSPQRSQNSRIRPESTAFFGAVNNASVMGRNLPQPVIARNSSLVQAWHAWTHVHEGNADRGVMAQLMATTRRSFEQNLATLLRYARTDPIWQLNVPTQTPNVEEDFATLLLPTAALMFWSREHALVESTEALEHLLLYSDIGDDLPASLFRPPAPAIFIHFGRLFRNAIPLAPTRHPLDDVPHLQGVYVFHSEREENRAVSIVPVFELMEQRTFCANSIELVINDESRSLNSSIAYLCEASGQGKHFSAIVQIVAKIFFYMEQAHAVQNKDVSYTVAIERMKGRSVKKAARIGRHITDLYDRVLLGPHEVFSLHPGEISPHLRRGHFRMQPYGRKSSLRKVIFVAPTWIRPDRLSPERSE